MSRLAAVRRAVALRALAAAGLVWLLGTGARAGTLDTFAGATVASATWSVAGGACLTAGTGAAPTGGIPGCPSGTQPGGTNGTFPETPGSGVLRLTSNAANATGSAISSAAQSTAGGIAITFTEYAYDAPSALGTGVLAASGDGVSLFLVDATAGGVPAPGTFGGPLGYGTTGANGIARGVLGVGFDEAGGFTSGGTSESVTLRAGTAGAFGQLATKRMTLLGLGLSGIDTPSATTRGGAATRRWRIVLAPSGTIEVDGDFGSGYTTVLAPTPLGAAVPSSVYVGVAASTVNGQDVHEVANLATSSLAGSYAFAHGPVGAPAAVGSFDGVSAVNANDDFTERSFTQASFTAVYGAAPPAAGSQYTQAIGGIAVPNAVANTGALADAYALAATAPAGWTVGLYPDNGTGTPGSGTGGNGPGATALPQPGGAAGTSGATASGALSVAAGATAVYWAVYAAPAGVRTFTRFDAPIVATSANVATLTNATHDELYSGFLYATKALAVTAGGCPAGQTPPAGGVCPGGTLAYTIGYGNVALGGGSGNTEPASAVLTPAAGSFTIVEDGAAGTNTWAATTTGLQSPPVDSTAGSAFGYGAANATAFAAGSTRFSDVVGGGAGVIAPGATGTVTFSVTVR